MKVNTIVFLSIWTVTSLAQTNNLFSSLLSDAQSIYTIVTSVLASPQTASSSASISSPALSSASPSPIYTPSSASAPSTASAPFIASASSSVSAASSASAASTPSSTSLSSSSGSSSLLSPPPTSTPSATSSFTSAVAQATASKAAVNSSGGNGGGSNTLAVVLGCTLGALALAAFLALLFLCLRRKRRSRHDAKHGPLSSDDTDEIEAWRHDKPRFRSFKDPMSSTAPLGTSAAAAPLMTRHTHDPHHRDEHQNPFVPVPPPARRSSRAGLHDTGYSAHPFSPEHINRHDPTPYFPGAYNEHHGSHALAAGLGGTALGGLAAHAKHRHDRKRSASRGRDAAKADPAFSEDELNTLPQTAEPGRRSGSISRANAREPWPFMDAKERRSRDSRRSSSRTGERFLTPDQHPSDHTDVPAAGGGGRFVGAALGALAGTALARHYDQHSPQRKGILKQTVSDVSDPSSLSDNSRASRSEADAVPTAHNSGPHELASADVPVTPVVREKSSSPLINATPLAAAGMNGATAAARRRSGSSRRMSADLPALALSAAPDSEYRPPIVPCRSPKRHSLDSRARYSTANEGTVELPASTSKYEMVSPPLGPHFVESDDPEAVTSPVSPITASNPGTLMKAQAAELGTSQESTAVDSQSPASGVSEGSNQHSSGLVSAIQNIFSSQKAAWAEENSPESGKSRPHADELGTPYNDDQRRIVSITRRKPAPSQRVHQIPSHYGEIDTTGTTVQNPVEPVQQPQTYAGGRGSVESALPLPRYGSRDNEIANTTQTADFSSSPAQTAPFNGNRPRTGSRPGYGLGSGDPFDLARVRTDSSMTGVSLSGQQYLPDNRPNAFRVSSGSHDYREPTLAELRRQVQEEDKQRVRHARARRHSRGDSAGLRYGDDRELFDLVDRTTGRGQYEPDLGRFYAQPTASRRSSGGVGRAF